MATPRENSPWEFDPSLILGEQPPDEVQLGALYEDPVASVNGGLVIDVPQPAAPARATVPTGPNSGHQAPWPSTAGRGRVVGPNPSAAPLATAAGGSGGPTRRRAKRVASTAGPLANRTQEQRSPPNSATVAAFGKHVTALHRCAVDALTAANKKQRELEVRQATLSTHQRETAQRVAKLRRETERRVSELQQQVDPLVAGVAEAETQVAQAWVKYNRLMSVLKRVEADSGKE